MKVSEFDFDLPPQLIAQEPLVHRGASRLLHLNPRTGELADLTFSDLPSLLHSGDLLVFNDTRVFPARLIGRRLPGGGVVECLLLRRVGHDGDAEIWEALVHPGQRLRTGSRMEFAGGDVFIEGEILDRRFHGRRTVRLRTDGRSLERAVDDIGHVPLPPYIKRDDDLADRDRYQTIYARARGSIAAPTAGLHFTPQLLSTLDARGIERAFVTLHVGYGTFQPVRVEDVEQHAIEPEEYEVTPETASTLSRARAERRRIVAVGTTTVRTLESLTIREGVVEAGRGSTNLFVHPGHQFQLVAGLVTNFHLPRSSLLMLVSALAGQERVRAAYRHAIAEHYRFYSYGDAMAIV